MVDDDPAGPTARKRLARLRAAESLADLLALTDADSEHEAYFRAKDEWVDLQERFLPDADRTTDDVPGDCVVVDGHAFHVHGVTHAGTDAERAFLREHVSRYLDAGTTVYCEQGIRPMYFDDFEGACEMDDYRWAMRECERLDVESHLEGTVEEFDGIGEDVDAIASQFREAVFSLVDASGDGYGDRFRRALGDVASAFLTSHADAATGEDFESFRRSRAAATDPSMLASLQRYYAKTFLPQPVEREWLRRHDPELELMTHARNERMAAYALYHNDAVTEVHLVVGAAHQPGVVYYLERAREGVTLEFEPISGV